MSNNNELENEEEQMKIILLGNTGVGKTAIITQFDQNTYNNKAMATYAPNFIKKDLKINNEVVKVHVWDTAGQEKFNSVSKLFVKNAKIIILVYDITEKSSFEGLDYWYNFIKNDLVQDVVIGLAGNKVDLLNEDGFEEQVSQEEAEKFAEKLGAEFSLLSAKCDKKGIDDFFVKLITKYIDKFFIPINNRKTIMISNKTQKQTDKKKKNCC